jgi:hypothetical protein
LSSLEQAIQTQITNIQKKTGKSFDELAQLVRSSGLSKHADIREMLKRELALGHGDANSLVHAVLESDGTRAAAANRLSMEDVLNQIYSGPKAGLRPIHETLMARIDRFGEFESLPKKGYISLRRKRQFAMIGPGTNTRVDVGINAMDLGEDARLLAQPKGSMCNSVVRLTGSSQVDEALIGWLKAAYESAG